MSRCFHSQSMFVVVTVLTGLPMAMAADFSPDSVQFAPGYEHTFEAQYGAREVPTLRSEIAQTVSQSLKAAHGSCRLDLNVVVDRAAPTHPTMKQQSDEPGLDPIRTVYRNGGAALTGRVLGSDGKVLATVTHRYFSDTLPPISPARDPWSEARVAISQFSSKLVEACEQKSGEQR
ncbi:MAG TPA: hypothetical protein VGF89_02930 [Steroidobacteraceae bacterium]|jgi:hypothetical protein